MLRWHPERRQRRCFNELDLLDGMTQEELRDNIKKLENKSKTACQNSCC